VGDSRLIMPREPPRYVPRPRLISELDDTWDIPLVLLSAGPGSGKTALLADWARHTHAHVAWVTPAAADGRPDKFWRLLMSALRARRVITQDPLAMAADDPADRVRTLFGTVSDDVSQLAVVIDDAHVLNDPEVLDGLDSIVRGWQPGFRLILAARSDPVLPLHRYRLAGQMRELRAADLAMTKPEIRHLLDTHGVTLNPKEFEVLAARTEGWTAGVRLSAMRMQDSATPGEFVSDLALDQGSIGEYLVDEVLRHRPAAERRLLIETSFLDEVTGPLAEAVTGMHECGEMLAQLARDNSFVIPLDAVRKSFRYHQLLAEILRYLLQRQSAPPPTTLKARASAWYEQNGNVGSALYWATHIGDRSRVASLLTRGGFVDAFVSRRDLNGTGLTDLLPGTPDDAKPAERLVLTLAESVIAAVSADPGSAARELTRVRARLQGQLPPDDDSLCTADLTELVLGQKAFDRGAVDRAAQRLMARCRQTPESPIPGLGAAVLLAEAGAHFWDGDLDSAGLLLREALAEAEHAGSPALRLEVLSMTAFLDNCRSRPSSAEEAMRRAQKLLRRHSDLAPPTLLDLATAVQCTLAADFSGQAQAVRRARMPDVAGSDPGVAVMLTFHQAIEALAQDDCGNASVILRQIEGPLPPLLSALRDLLLASLHASLGRPHMVLQLLQPHRSGPFDGLVAVPRARAYLALDDQRSAIDCVRKVKATPSEHVGRLTLVEAILCEAEIAQLRDDPDRVLELLLRALEIARGEIALPFTLVADKFAGLLSRHPELAEQWPSRRQAIPALPASDTRRTMASALPEPLTEREQAVLRFLATSMSNSEIADELCLSINTVKTHLAAIYRKLPARRRREAVLRARQLELI
jgi:LuxR family maltose regulon positive regulatory protein